ncbi:hypothetical protein JCM8547_008127 [Rhodosporidiobolus lusitaniae]
MAEGVRRIYSLAELHALLDEQKEGAVVVVEFSEGEEPILSPPLYDSTSSTDTASVTLAHVKVSTALHASSSSREGEGVRRAFRFRKVPQWVFLRDGRYYRGLNTTSAHLVPSRLSTVLSSSTLFYAPPSTPIPTQEVHDSPWNLLSGDMEFFERWYFYHRVPLLRPPMAVAMVLFVLCLYWSGREGGLW